MGMHLLISHMFKAAAAVVCGLGFALTGCGTVPDAKLYGNHAAASEAFDRKVAGDAIKQLVALYPPASTRFNLTQAAPDAFGTALVTGLREKGFALMEGKAGSQIGTAANAAGMDGLELHYLLDRPGAGDLYRLTLAIGSQRLSRPYLVQNGTPYAAGAWVWKE